DYLGKKIPSDGMDFMNLVIDDIPTLSVISKIEVLGFNAADDHYQLLNDFMNDAIILNLTESVVDKSIEIRKNFKTKLPDAIIAATALINDLVLITRNKSDFQNTSSILFLFSIRFYLQILSVLCKLTA